jgi:drug/metabolite transporter (DMT)-like permease
MVPVAGATDDYTGMGIATAAALAGSALVGVGGGDTLYVLAMQRLGMSRAFTITLALYTVLTYVLAVLLLDERVTWVMALGSVLVVLGVYIVATRGREAIMAEESLTARSGPDFMRGLVLVVVAAILWSIATVWLRGAADDLNSVAVGAARLPAAGLLLIGTAAILPRSSLRRRQVTRSSFVILLLGGALGTGIGSLLFIYAVQEAGAGRAAVLTSISPLFALPMGALFLGERMTAWVLAGTVLVVTGIVLLA